MTLPAKSIPETIAHLDTEIIAAALVRNDASIRNAARELNVPSADLRKLVLVDQRLADASTEAVELQLDECEANLREGLRSDDPKRRDAVSMFMLRNRARAARRGYATATAAASLEIKSTEPQTLIFRWRSPDDDPEPAMETFERDGRTFEVPKYGTRRSDDAIEGALSEPAAMIDHRPVLAAPVEGAVERLGADPAGADRVDPAAPAAPPLPEWPGPYPPPPGVAHLYASFVQPDPVEANRRRLEALRRAGYG